MRRSQGKFHSPRSAAVMATLLSTTLALGGLSSILSAAPASAVSSQLTWSTVANLGDTPPGSAQTFNSFNQPSVNDAGMVVFRARTSSSQPVRGIYIRNTQSAGQPISKIGEVGDEVPQPNNSGGTFTEFPSFARIDATSSNIVTRGQSTPVWEYSTDGGVTNVNEGTSGLYATTGGALETGASALGNAPGQEIYQVPGQTAGTKFDQFPGAAAIDGNTIVFKGNYTAGTSGLTGVFYRDLSQSTNAVQLIADSSTLMPGQPSGGTLFGSTAPPSAANGQVVFTGWDNEDAPTLGGIYLADIAPSPTLTPLVSIGDAVPGQGGATFTNFGEGLSFDGRYVGFWGSWGSAMQSITLACPSDGNADLIAYCLTQYPNGYTTSVPLHQGIFVYDTVAHSISLVAATDSRFSGFQFWVYSGAPPGVGSGDASMEPPRWRASAFAAVSGSGTTYQAAFKATTVTGTTGIYLGQGVSGSAARILVAVHTGDAASAIDSAAPAGTLVSAVGLERDGFRGRFLAINVSMLDPTATTSWAGVYVTSVPSNLATEDQSITFSATSPAYIGDHVVLSASSSSDLPVSFGVNAASASICTLDPATSTLTYNAVGSCVIDATQAGDAAYNAATASSTIDVTLRPQTITFPMPPAAYLGGDFALSATSSSGLPPTYTIDVASASVCTLDAATSTLTYTAVGTCSVTATQAGDTTYSAASPVTRSFDVTLQPQVITAPAPSVAYLFGSYVMNATSDSGLPVTYALNSGSEPGVCTLNGATIHFAAVGTCAIDVSQAGDALHAPASITVRITVVVAPPAPVSVPTTPQVITVPPAPTGTVGSSYDLAAVTDSGLPVTYSVDPTSTAGTCTLSGSTVVFAGTGTCVISITQPGDTVFMAATPVSQQIVVGAMGTSIRLTGVAASLRYGQVSRASAIVTQASGSVSGTVRFSLDGHEVGAALPVVNGKVTSAPLRSATGALLRPGVHLLGAAFTPSNPAAVAAASTTGRYIVKKAATRLMVQAHLRTISARAITVAPGTGRATGVVTFKLSGKVIGRAVLRGGVATLAYRVTPTMARLVRATYGGNAFLLGSTSLQASYRR